MQLSCSFCFRSLITDDLQCPVTLITNNNINYLADRKIHQAENYEEKPNSECELSGGDYLCRTHVTDAARIITSETVSHKEAVQINGNSCKTNQKTIINTGKETGGEVSNPEESGQNRSGAIYEDYLISALQVNNPAVVAAVRERGRREERRLQEKLGTSAATSAATLPSPGTERRRIVLDNRNVNKARPAALGPSRFGC